MISYRYEEEAAYLDYHIEKMGETKVKEILLSESIKSKEDAEYLAKYFWRMVDFSIEEEKSKIELPWPESREFWNEKLMNSIAGYIEREGYEEVWDQVLDQQ